MVILFAQSAMPQQIQFENIFKNKVSLSIHPATFATLGSRGFLDMLDKKGARSESHHSLTYTNEATGIWLSRESEYISLSEDDGNSSATSNAVSSSASSGTSSGGGGDIVLIASTGDVTDVPVPLTWSSLLLGFGLLRRKSV